MNNLLIQAQKKASKMRCARDHVTELRENHVCLNIKSLKLDTLGIG